MKTLTRIALALCLLSAGAFAQYANVKAKLTDGEGNVLKSGFMRFQLENCGENFPLISGINTSLVQTTIDMKPNQPDGTIIGRIYGNDSILCGNIASTYWEVTLMKDAQTPLSPLPGMHYYICSSPTCYPYGGYFDPSTAQALNDPPPKPGYVFLIGNPSNTINQIWTQPAGTSAKFAGLFTFQQGVNLGAAPVAALSGFTPAIGAVITVKDGNGATDCTIGGGTSVNFCLFNGITWSAVTGSGGGGGGLGDPGLNGIVFRTSLNITRAAANADIMALFSGTCSVSTFLRGDGQCAAVPSGLGDPGNNGVLFRSSLNATRLANVNDIIGLWAGGCSLATFLRGDGQCADPPGQSVGTSGKFQYTDGSGNFLPDQTQTDGSGNLTNINSIAGSGTGTTVWTVSEGVAPSLPGTAGQANEYIDSTTHKWQCFLHDGTNCAPAGGSSSFSALTSGTNTIGAFLIGTGASLGATGSGTIHATTADALSATPTQCTSGQFSTGIAANGNANCSTPAGGGSGAGGGVGTSFTAQTSVTIAGTTHNIGSKNLLVQCYDNSTPAQAINPASYTVNASTFDVVVNFSAAQTGYCVVSGLGPPKYSTSFTSVTTETVTGATHGLGRSDLSVTIWDNASPRNRIEAASVTVNPTTFDVVATFAAAQSGTIVIQ